MFKIKKVIIAIAIVLIVGSISILLFQKSKPKNVIEDKLGIKLSAESKVMNFNYNMFDEYFDAKILFGSDSIDSIKKELDNYFGGIADENTIERIPNFRNTCSWWDLDIQNIELCYTRFVAGEKKIFRDTLKSREVWAFISKDNNSQYYLYISY